METDTLLGLALALSTLLAMLAVMMSSGDDTDNYSSA